MWAQIINIIAGVFIMMSPDLFGYDKQLANHNHITGPLIVTFAITAIWEVNRNARWINLPVALWLVIITIVHGESAAMLPNILAAAAVLLFTLWPRKGKEMYAGGWRSLFQEEPYHLKVANRQEK